MARSTASARVAVSGTALMSIRGTMISRATVSPNSKMERIISPLVLFQHALLLGHVHLEHDLRFGDGGRRPGARRRAGRRAGGAGRRSGRRSALSSLTSGAGARRWPARGRPGPGRCASASREPSAGRHLLHRITASTMSATRTSRSRPPTRLPPGARRGARRRRPRAAWWPRSGRPVTTRREVATKPMEFSIRRCRLRAPGVLVSTSCCTRTRRTAATAVSSADQRKAITKRAPASSDAAEQRAGHERPPASPSRAEGVASKSQADEQPDQGQDVEQLQCASNRFRERRRRRRATG